MAFLIHIVSVITLILPVTLGYGMLFGRGKILHFGPIAVALIAAYGIFLANAATGSYMLGILTGTVAALALSLLFAWLSLRLKPEGLGVLSIAMHLIILNVVLNWTGFTRGSLGVSGIARAPFLTDPLHFALVSLIVCVLWIGFFVWLNRTAFARGLSALAEQEWYAQSLGISRPRVHIIMFLILGLVIVSDNFFFAQYYHLLHPNDYQFPAFLTIVMIVVAGKPGSVWGTVLAAVLLTLLKEGMRFAPIPFELLGPLRLMLFGLILIAAVYWRRDSLFPVQRSV